jgi:uncharacterized membrane protein SpoIIM required for sporulation
VVVERIFQIKEIRTKPYLISVVAFIFVCISVILATMAHQPPMGFFIIALAVMPAIPFFMRMIISEEKGEEIFIAFICSIPPQKFEKGKKQGLVSLYNNLIKLYMYFFLGSVIGFAFTASIMPQVSSTLVFSDIRNLFSSVSPTVDASFQGIFLHNLYLMLIMMFFSLVYSIGAIFLLVLNAAVIGLFLETEIRAKLLELSSLGMFAYPAAFISGSAVGILKLLPHGICEFSGFFIASVAGGIISVAIERKAYERRAVLKIILRDVAKLLLLAILLLAIGAFIESSYSSLPAFLK